jgi:5'-nucleotidase
MKVLVTNDDGITSRGLWELVSKLHGIAQVLVVAPDKERSAIGTAVSLRDSLLVQSYNTTIPNVEAYSINGTPSDSVILALTRLAIDNIDLVVSGINHGPNLGDDVLISGTVGAAIQGHLHGLPALAISVDSWDDPFLDSAANLAAIFVNKLDNGTLSSGIFLNINLPNLPANMIKGIQITHLANRSHINTVNDGYNGEQSRFWLVRKRLKNHSVNNTDIGAIDNNYISITHLHTNLSQDFDHNISPSFCLQLFREFQHSSEY